MILTYVLCFHVTQKNFTNKENLINKYQVFAKIFMNEQNEFMKMYSYMSAHPFLTLYHEQTISNKFNSVANEFKDTG